MLAMIARFFHRKKRGGETKLTPAFAELYIGMLYSSAYPVAVAVMTTLPPLSHPYALTQLSANLTKINIQTREHDPARKETVVSKVAWESCGEEVETLS